MKKLLMFFLFMYICVTFTVSAETQLPDVKLDAKYSSLDKLFNITVSTDVANYADSASVFVGAYKNNTLQRVILNTGIDQKLTAASGSLNYQLDDSESPEDYEFRSFTFTNGITPVMQESIIKGSDAPPFETQSQTIQSTNDTADRTDEIEAALEKYGKVFLSKGDFYVSSINMPPNTALYGCGANTRIILSEEISEGAAITLGGHNTVSDITLFGITVAAKPTSSVLGTRDGIYCPEGTPGNIITNCYIRGFSGSGIHILKTGYHELNSVIISNCKITLCGAGLNFDEKAEYGVVTNVVCTKNYYGLKNDGGNNKFSSCGFDGNVYGFYMNASSINSPNNGHGTCSGVTFNHNSQYAVYIRNLNHGYVFNGCQLFDGKIDLWITCGVRFNSCQFGSNTGFFSGYGTVSFVSDCVFANAPTFKTDSNKMQKIIVSSCYTLTGDAVTFDN